MHIKELGELFAQVVRPAHEMGLVKLGAIAVGSIEVEANTSRHKAMSYVVILKPDAELKAQIQALLNESWRHEVQSLHVARSRQCSRVP